MALAGAQLNLSPGQKGLTKLLGGVPSWVTFQDKEKVEVSHGPSICWSLLLMRTTCSLCCASVAKEYVIVNHWLTSAILMQGKRLELHVG